ncbi:HVA22-like protein j [Daucus carota subsp. sativus]|uniref:HVA22-like protein j n=1 Tax=Daucus carota subsp. sativus TaxID=79200 RepID=UPI0007EF19C8|nr:PREDICTED: HVA22-like protein j [Daucus carota subsp. sativus]
MLAEIIFKLLVMVLGYAYPAFLCFKTVEKNKVKIEQLRFWCQYWIIVALMTALERISDIFLSWVPLYAEMKLALFLFLLYPKTKGTRFVYETLLRPFVMKHEKDMDSNLQELRSRMWDSAIYCYHNCSELGQTMFFEVTEHLASKQGKFGKAGSEKRERNRSKASLAPRLQTIFSFSRGSRSGKNRGI